MFQASQFFDVLPNTAQEVWLHDLQTITGNPHLLPLRPVVGGCNGANIKKANKYAYNAKPQS
jgi:hypothetical protein